MFKNIYDEAVNYLQRGHYPIAKEKFLQLLDQHPGNHKLMYYMGTISQAEGHHGLAVVLLTASCTIRADFHALVNLGGAYRSLMMLKEAEACWRQALSAPDPKEWQYEREKLEEMANLWANIAGLYVNVGDPQKCVDAAKKALTFDENCDAAHANLALGYLELGNWKDGFAQYETLLRPGTRRIKDYGVPLWDGKPTDTLIICGEQGIGDEIMFASILGDVQAKKLVIDCHPRNEKLFRRSFPKADIFPTRKNPDGSFAKNYPGAKCTLIGSLGHFYRAKGHFPRTPYLDAPAAKPGGTGRLRVGIAWSGGTLKTNSADRSLSLDQIKPILEVAGIDWFSVQYQDSAPLEICDFHEKTGIRIDHFPGWVQAFDYDKTAQFVKGLDLLITPCTSIVHLAGALGVENWCLTPKRVAWRYGVTGDMPWYGSTKLYRQEVDGEWESVIKRVAEDLWTLDDVRNSVIHRAKG